MNICFRNRNLDESSDDVNETNTVDRTREGEANTDRMIVFQDPKYVDYTSPTFIPGSIHNKQYQEFWKNELQAGEWVMETLKNGYVIPFLSLPPPYEEPNNKSAINDPEFVFSKPSTI